MVYLFIVFPSENTCKFFFRNRRIPILTTHRASSLITYNYFLLYICFPCPDNEFGQLFHVQPQVAKISCLSICKQSNSLTHTAAPVQQLFYRMLIQYTLLVSPVNVLLMVPHNYWNLLLSLMYIFRATVSTQISLPTSCTMFLYTRM
jgi:hypothetical protein